MRADIYALTSELTSLSTQRLEAISQFWGTSPALARSGSKGSSSHTLGQMEKFMSAMANPWAAMNVLDKLTPIQKSVIVFALEHEDEAFQISELRDIVPRGMDIKTEIEPLLYHLALWMSWGGWISARATPWTDRHRFFEGQHLTIPLFLRAPIESALVVSTIPEADMLRLPLSALAGQVPQIDLASQLGIHESIIRNFPGQLSRLIAASLRFPASIEALLRKVPSRARRIFEELARAGEPVLLDHLVSERAGSAAKGPLSKESGAVEELLPLLGELYDKCLVLPAQKGGERACWVHPEVAAAFRGQEPAIPPPVIHIEPASAPPAVALSNNMNLWWDLMVVGLWIESGDAALTSSTKQVPKKNATQLVRSMSPLSRNAGIGDQEVVAGIFNILSLADIVRIDGLRMTTYGAWDKWKTGGLLYQVGAIFTGWMNRVLSESGMIVPFPGLFDPVASTLEVRRRLWRWLDELTPGAWYDLLPFLQHIRSKEPFFLRSKDRILQTMGEVGIFDLHQSWLDQEGLAVAVMLNQIPYSAGIVDVGRGPDEDDDVLPQFLRLTDFGEEAIRSLASKKGKDSRIVLESSGKATGAGQPLLIQPNLEVTMLEFDPCIAYELGRFANSTRFDLIGVFTLTPESVKRAAGRGMSYEQMISTLSRYSRQPVPQNVEYQLKDWANSVRRVQFERATVIEVDTPEDMERLLSTKPMRSKLRRRLSPTTALLAVGEDLKSLSKSLDVAGFHWNPPDDWEDQEEAAYNGITRILKQFDPYRR